MKNMVEVQFAMLSKSSFIQHPVNKNMHQMEREHSFGMSLEPSGISSEPLLQRAVPRVHRSKFKFSRVQSL